MSSDIKKDPILFADDIEEIQDKMTTFTFSFEKVECGSINTSPEFVLKGTKLLCQVILSFEDCNGTFFLDFRSNYKSFCVDKPHFTEISFYHPLVKSSINVAISNENPTFNTGPLPYPMRGIKVTVAYKIKCYESINDENVTLLSNMRKIYADDKSSDVIINVEGEEFSAHKVILINNPVFAAMLQNDMLESRTNVIHINEMDPAIFKIILRFIYFGNTGNINFIELGDDFLINLIIAADMYQIIYLREKLINIAIRYLDPENVIKFFICSDKINNSNLKKICNLYIHNNRMKVVDTLSFQELIKENLNLTGELLVYMMKKNCCNYCLYRNTPLSVRSPQISRYL